MSSHTPGPWVFNESIPRTVKAPKDGYITRHICDMDASTISAFDQDANARLIAAAPDLLEALSLLVAGIEDSVSPTFIPLAKARDAIAKATGEKS